MSARDKGAAMTVVFPRDASAWNGKMWLTAHGRGRSFNEGNLRPWDRILDPADPLLVRDAERLNEIRAARDAAAAAYFERNAADWERVRALHLPEADIDSAVLAAAGPGPFDLMVDVGVGQGRMIQLFADRVRKRAHVKACRARQRDSR